MTGRRIGALDDVRLDWWIHRYRHSSNACKSRRTDKEIACRKDRRNKSVILSVEKKEAQLWN